MPLGKEMRRDLHLPYYLTSSIGVSQIVDYVAQIALHPQTWLGFPSDVSKTEVAYELSEVQELHR